MAADKQKPVLKTKARKFPEDTDNKKKQIQSPLRPDQVTLSAVYDLLFDMSRRLDKIFKRIKRMETAGKT